jgi:hypothetical protein
MQWKKQIRQIGRREQGRKRRQIAETSQRMYKVANVGTDTRVDVATKYSMANMATKYSMANSSMADLSTFDGTASFSRVLAIDVRSSNDEWQWCVAVSQVERVICLSHSSLYH